MAIVPAGVEPKQFWIDQAHHEPDREDEFISSEPLEMPYAAAWELLAAVDAALLSMRRLAEKAGDVPEWNEGGHAYQTCEQLRAARDQVRGEATPPEKPELEISKMLTVNLAQVSDHDREILIDRATGCGGGFICHSNADCDILQVLVEEGAHNETDEEMVDNYGYSSEFMALVTLARENDCDWLRLHIDGPICGNLRVFE